MMGDNIEPSIDSLLSQIKDIAATSDEVKRSEIRDALRDLQYSLEGPDDTINRYGYYHLQTAAVRVGFDLGLFKLLEKSEEALSVTALAEQCNAEASLVARYMRYLAGIGAVQETGKDHFAANEVCKNLAQPVCKAGISHCFETIGPQYQEIPRYLKSTGYRNPKDPKHTVFQDAHKTDKTGFGWFSDHPENLKFFNEYMALRRRPEQSWLSVYPVEDEAKRWSGGRSPEAPLYVNIGGSIGHQCRQFKQRYPEIPGRVVLQDLEHSVNNAMQTPGVENMVHNFFDPQPLKGAKFYYFRAVLHNHPDDAVCHILRNVKQAMTQESVLLLDEWVMPETGVSAYAASMDLTFMAAFASLERTEVQWREVLDRVGLRLVHTYPYYPLSYECVMDVRLA